MQWNVWLASDDFAADAILSRVYGTRRETLDMPPGARELRSAFVLVGTFDAAQKTVHVGESSTTLAAFLESTRGSADERCYFLDVACADCTDPFLAADVAGSILAAAVPGEGWVVAVRPLPLQGPHPVLRWLTDIVCAGELLGFDDAYDQLASSSYSGRSAPALGRAQPSFELSLGAFPEPLVSMRDLAAAADALQSPRPPAAGPVDDEVIPEPPPSLSINVDVDVDFASGASIPVAAVSMSSGELHAIPSVPALAIASAPNLELSARGSWVPWEEEAEALATKGFRDQAWNARLATLMERAALEPRRAEALLMRLVDSFARDGAAREAGAVCRQLAILRRDVLADVSGAIDAFRGAVRCTPAQPENHRDLAALLATGVDAPLAAACLDESIGILGPDSEFLVLRRSTLARFDIERATLAGAIAVAFGDTRFGPDAESIAAAAPLRPARALRDADWALIRHDDMTADVSAIFRIVEDAALAMRADEKRLAPLDAGTALDPQGTATIVRTVGWASQILGLPAVPVHHVESTRHDLIAHPGPPACVVVGPRAISGRSLVELSFLAARHLTYYLPGHRISLQYVSVDELAMLFWAALLTVREEIPAALREATATMRWREGLRVRLSPAARAELATAVARVEAQGGRVDLAAWVRGLELTANRLGFLLAGDPARAIAMVRGEDRRVGGLEGSGRLADLAVWGASAAHVKLRRELVMRA